MPHGNERSRTEKPENSKPFETVKLGSISIPIYAHSNKIPQRDAATGAILYETLPDGTRKAVVKYAHAIYTIAYYEGTRRVWCKFSALVKARQEAEGAAIKLANGETEALKLQGADRADYVRAMQKLREWRPDANLNVAINHYVETARRLPENVTLQKIFNFYLKRHPIGLPPKSVRGVVDELIKSKSKSGKSEVYIKDLRSRLGQFADAFRVRISAVTGNEIEIYIRNLRTPHSDENSRRSISARTENNVRQMLNTLFKGAIKRGYVPTPFDISFPRPNPSDEAPEISKTLTKIPPTHEPPVDSGRHRLGFASVVSLNLWELSPGSGKQIVACRGPWILSPGRGPG